MAKARPGVAADRLSRGIIRRVTDPVAIRIGPLAVHWYGIILASAILFAAWLGTAELKRRGEDPETGWSMLLWVIAGGVIGARLYHVIHQWDFYSANPGLIPQVWNGGLGIPGAVAGGALVHVALHPLAATSPPGAGSTSS